MFGFQNPAVELGWVNNIKEATVVATYDSGARVEGKFTQNPASEDASEVLRAKPIHPGNDRSVLEMPVLDAKLLGDGVNGLGTLSWV